MTTRAPTGDDAYLLRAAAGGDQSALRGLYDRHAAWLYARLLRRCNDPEVVADVLQDTFFAVWNGAGRWRGDGDVAAWIWGIGIRRLVSRLRGRHVPAPVSDGDLDAATDTVMSAEEAVLLGVEHGALGAALDRMSPELRAVVQAMVMDGLTARQAATLLGVPEGTVKGRIRKAKELLRGELLLHGETAAAAAPLGRLA
jgi:RNA polymerase sigma factor (sigma-70 family)